MPHHRPQPVVPYHIIYDNNVKVDSAHSRVDLKEARINTLETDKALKDTKIAALETDKSEKDTKMSTMESDMTALTNRVTALETLGIKGISNAVNWTNLTEINLSGEKLTNGDFSQLGYVENLSYTFPTSPNGNHNTHYVFASTNRPLVIALKNRDGMTKGEVYEMHRYHVGNGKANIEITSGNMAWVSHRGVNWEVVEKVPTNWTVKNGTLNQTKLAQGIIKGSGGQVAIEQTFSQNIASGTRLVIKVTSDDDIKFIPIKANGQADLNNDFTVFGADEYAEYTTQTNTSAFKVSTVNGLREFGSISIFQGAISGGTVQAYAGGGLEKISGTGGWNAGASSVQKIDGNSDGYVQFQWVAKSVRVGLKYSDTDFDVDSPYLHINFVTNTIGSKSVSPGDWFRIRHYASTNEIHYQRKEAVGAGQDYVTFYTEPTLTNGNDLYVDVSLYHVGTRLNDITIVT